MAVHKHSDNWLFQKHSRQSISTWLKTLKYFRYMRAVGGHANDGDQFILTLTFPSDFELNEALSTLDLRKANGVTDFMGRKIFLLFRENSFDITVSGTRDGNYYEVSDEDYQACLNMETVIEEHDLVQFVRYNSDDSPACVTLEKYPELKST